MYKFNLTNFNKYVLFFVGLKKSILKASMHSVMAYIFPFLYHMTIDLRKGPKCIIAILNKSNHDY